MSGFWASLKQFAVHEFTGFMSTSSIVVFCVTAFISLCFILWLLKNDEIDIDAAFMVTLGLAVVSLVIAVAWPIIVLFAIVLVPAALVVWSPEIYSHTRLVFKRKAESIRQQDSKSNDSSERN